MKIATTGRMFGAAIRVIAPLVATSVAADPLTDLLAKGSGKACYERVYDDAHLAANPKQTTRSVLLSLHKDEARDGAIIRIQIASAEESVYIVGECSFEKKANLDIQDKPLIAAFKGPSGLDCHASTSADGASAEEGGDFPVDLRDGAAIVLYVPESLAAWSSFDRSQPAEWPEFGAEDQVFKLGRTGTGACREMDDGLPWLM